MQLEHNEKSILAYFSSLNKAQEAFYALKQSGEFEIRLDQLNTARRTSTLSSSLASLTEAGNDPDLYSSYGPLLAANPSSSGMSSPEEPTSFSYLITVVTRTERYQNVMQTLKSYNATL
ncbi:MAG: hypothetical protein U9N81_13790 [Bacillota bacterium]|nr:hypothetical protein [Bacillota bacterium]